MRPHRRKKKENEEWGNTRKLKERKRKEKTTARVDWKLFTRVQVITTEKRQNGVQETKNKICYAFFSNETELFLETYPNKSKMGK